MEKRKLPDDLLPEQIVEDEAGNIRVLPVSALLDEPGKNMNPLTETTVGKENLEKDMPCADLQAED